MPNHAANPLRPAQTDEPPDYSARQYVSWLLLILGIAAVLRGVFPVADPPWHAPVGIVWHDEGAWTHNARNQVLFGAWRTDAWNPMFLAPVFTAFEYLSFRLFGVGLWQARLVSELAGLLSVAVMAFAVRTAASRRTAVAAAALLAVNYVWVMWNRAALMETTMVSFLLASACAYAHADRRPVWGAVAGVLAIAAFFTKASAAFFVAALTLDCLMVMAWPAPDADVGARTRGRKSALWTMAGIAAAAGVALVFFVLPYWQEFRFYNWQMSVVRKPSYGLTAFMDRAAWLPIVHDFFTRMWVVVLLAVCGLLSAAFRWRRNASIERLFVLWIAMGVAELLVHDVGNERRLVLLIPPLVGLAAIVLVQSRRLLALEMARVTRPRLVLALPLVAYVMYVLVGSWVRLAFLYQVKPGVYLGAALAAALTAGLYAFWPRVISWSTQARWSAGSASVLLAVLIAGDGAQYGQWASSATQVNYQAMVDVGRTLLPDTLVQGKLSNGLALESRIRPVFVGQGFGNYDDRLTRDDIQYVLTYRRPRFGYEGRVIRDILDAYSWTVVRPFRVAESSSGDDEAVLLVKGPRRR